MGLSSALLLLLVLAAGLAGLAVEAGSAPAGNASDANGSAAGFAGLPAEAGSAQAGNASDATSSSTGASGDVSSMTWSCTVLSLGTEGAPREVSCNGTVLSVSEPEDLPVGTRMWWQSLFSAVGCVLCAAFAAGLTLGMTSFDEFGLRVLCNLDVNDIELGDDEAARARAQKKLLQDQQYAQKILPLISGQVSVSKRRSWMNPTSGHVLLVTLLVVNACANEALPIFLDKIVPAWLAVVLSVTVVLVFGEIVPSAIFTGPSQLRLAATFAPVIGCIRVLLFPLVWPISLLLDRCLGHEENENRRGEMKATAKTLMSAGLEPDEVNMIHGVLDMHRKTAEDIAKPLQKARMVAHDDIITKELIDQVLAWGHSRIFVYRRDPAAPECRSDIVGVLLVKKLLGVSLEEAPRVDSVHRALKEPVALDADENLLSVLNKFQDGMCHLGFVRAAPQPAENRQGPGVDAAAAAAESEGKATMFCSLEDVIETMLTEDIFDEEDLELGRAAGPGVLLQPGSSLALSSQVGSFMGGSGRLARSRRVVTSRYLSSA